MFLNLEDFCIPVENNTNEGLKACLNMFKRWKCKYLPELYLMLEKSHCEIKNSLMKRKHMESTDAYRLYRCELYFHGLKLYFSLYKNEKNP